MRLSHGSPALSATFDDPNLVSAGGLAPVLALAARCRLGGLVADKLTLKDPGGVNAALKVPALVAGMIAGADSIADMDLLRHGGMGRLFTGIRAPSTLGTFLRAFTFGHVRQLEAVVGEALRRAWSLGAGPGRRRLVVDMDSTICAVIGKLKQGAAFGYTKVLGYHPLLATRADTGEVLHLRMRKGSANSGRGAERFVNELVARLRRAGATGPLTMRADSAFHSSKVIKACRRLKVAFVHHRQPEHLGPGGHRCHPGEGLGPHRTTPTAAELRWPRSTTRTCG